MWKGVVASLLLGLFVATAATRPGAGGAEVRVLAAGGAGAAGGGGDWAFGARHEVLAAARVAPRRALLQQLPGAAAIAAPGAEAPAQPQPAPPPPQQQQQQQQQQVTAEIVPGDKAATEFAAAMFNQNITEIILAPGIDLIMRPSLFRGYGAGRPLGLFPLARDLTVRSADPGRMAVIDWAMTDAIILLPAGRLLTFSALVIKNIRYGRGAGVDFVRGTGLASRLRFEDCIWLRQVCLPPDNSAGIGLMASVRASNPNAPLTGAAAAPIALLPSYRFNGTEFTQNIVHVRNASLIVVPGTGGEELGRNAPEAGSSDTRFNWTLVNTTRLCEQTVDPQCLETNSANACYDAAFSALRAAKSAAQAAAAPRGDPPAAAVAVPVVVGTAALAGAAVWLFLARRRRRARKRAAGYQEGGLSKHMTQPGYAQAWATLFSLGEMRGGGMPGEGWRMVTRSSAPQFTGPPSATPPDSGQSYPSQPRLPAPGEHVQLGVLIGAGSFGRVYRGRWRGREVAVKVMLHDASVAATVAREIDLVMSFKHDNIVQAHHFIVWHKDQSSGSNAQNTNSDHFSDPESFQPSAGDVYTLTSCGGSHVVNFSEGTTSGATAGAAAGRSSGGAAGGAAGPAVDTAAAGTGPPGFAVVPFTRAWGPLPDGNGAAAPAPAPAGAAAASGEAPPAVEAAVPGGSLEQQGGLLAADNTLQDSVGRRAGDSATNSSLIQRFRAASQQALSLLGGGSSGDATSSLAAATATAGTTSASASVPSAEDTAAAGVAASGNNGAAAGRPAQQQAVREAVANSGGRGELVAEAAAGSPPGVFPGTSGPIGGGGVAPAPTRPPATRRTAARRSDGARGEFGSGSGGILKGEAQTWLVLEYCDKGNLADAVRDGLLHGDTEDEQSPDTGSDASGDGGDADNGDHQRADRDDAGSTAGERPSRGGNAGVTGGSSGPQDDASDADQRDGGGDSSGGARGPQRGRRGDRPPLASLDLPRALHLLVDVARGMAYLHARNVVHADLKCQNVLLTTAPGRPWGEAAKISDFGLSKALALDQTHVTTHSMGTVTHMPPEMFKTGRMSPAGDVYAFGVLVWEVLTGRGAFHGLHYAEVIEQVAIRGVRPPIPPGVPPELSALMEACWQADPTKRLGFDTLVTCLEMLLQACTATASGDSPLVSAKALLTPTPSLPGSRGTGGGAAAASGSTSSGMRAVTAGSGAATGSGGAGTGSGGASSSTSAAVTASVCKALAGPPPLLAAPPPLPLQPPLLMGPQAAALGEMIAPGNTAAPPPPPRAPALALHGGGVAPPQQLPSLPLLPRHTLHVVVPGAPGPHSRSSLSHGLTHTTDIAVGFATATAGAGPHASPALGSVPSGAESGATGSAVRQQSAAGKGSAAAVGVASSRRASHLLESSPFVEDL